MPHLFTVLSLVAVLTVVPTGYGAAEPANAPERRDASHTFGRLEDFFLEMRDGVRLHGSVYLPALADGERVPVVLDLGPYYGVLGAKDTDGFDPAEGLGSGHYEHLLERGYAIALVSLRGSGLSGGCLDFGGRLDQQDSYDLVEWLGSRPWSNGRVGMTGYSYDGSTPWAAAVAAPPSLRTIVPVAGISDWYSYSFRRGVPLAHGPVFNPYYASVTEHAYLGSRSTDFLDALASRGCAERPRVYSHGLFTYAHGDHDSFWDERDFRSQADRISASVLIVHGLLEDNVRTDHTTVFDAIPTQKAMLLGQWGHGFPWMDARSTLRQATYEAFTEAWFDRWLRDADPGEEPDVVHVQDSRGAWHTRHAWVDGAIGERRLELDAEGRLVDDASTDGALGWFVTPPGFAPNPPGGLRVSTLPDVAGTQTLPVDQPHQTQLVWTSAPLDGPTALSGEAVLDLVLSVDRPNAMLVGHVYDVAPDGTWTRVTHDYLDLRHRRSLDAGEDMPLLEPVSLALRFYPVEHVFEQGHRIGVILAGEAGQPLPHGSTRVKPQLARQTVHAGTLRLPQPPG